MSAGHESRATGWVQKKNKACPHTVVHGTCSVAIHSIDLYEHTIFLVTFTMSEKQGIFTNKQTAITIEFTLTGLGFKPNL